MIKFDVNIHIYIYFRKTNIIEILIIRIKKLPKYAMENSRIQKYAVRTVKKKRQNILK